MKIKQLIISLLCAGFLVAEEPTGQNIQDNKQNEIQHKNNDQLKTTQSQEEQNQRDKEIVSAVEKLIGLKNNNRSLENQFDSRHNNIKTKCNKETLEKLLAIKPYEISTAEEERIAKISNEKERLNQEIKLQQKKYEHNQNAYKQLGRDFFNKEVPTPFEKITSAMNNFVSEHKIIAAITGLGTIAGAAYAVYNWYKQSKYTKNTVEEKSAENDTTFDDFMGESETIS